MAKPCFTSDDGFSSLENCCSKLKWVRVKSTIFDGAKRKNKIFLNFFTCFMVRGYGFLGGPELGVFWSDFCYSP